MHAIRINITSYISEVWVDLGSLHESWDNQLSEAIDAYARADPVISQRLQLLKKLPVVPRPHNNRCSPDDVVYTYTRLFSQDHIFIDSEETLQNYSRSQPMNGMNY